MMRPEWRPISSVLREVHTEMDRAVPTAYGWRDLAARADPVFLTKETEDDHTYQGRLFWPSMFRDEALAPLLAFNAERLPMRSASGWSRKASFHRAARGEDEEDPEEA